MRNAGLEEAQAGIKTAGRNINNLRYADGGACEEPSTPNSEVGNRSDYKIIYLPLSPVHRSRDTADMTLWGTDILD